MKIATYSNKKSLYYYFYCMSYEVLEVYRLHFLCINSHNDMFDSYKFILSFDDLSDTTLIEYWQNVIKKNIDTYGKPIEFIIVQNDKRYREAIHFYNIVFKHLNDIDGLVLWMHSKADLVYDTNNIYNWICCIHYLCTFDMENLENVLCGDNKYCAAGPLLEKYNICANALYYIGGMYWINPKKIYDKFTNDIYDTISYIDTLLYYEADNDTIKFFGELWFFRFFCKENMMNWQNTLIDNIHFYKDGIFHSTYDTYIHSLDTIRHIFDDKIYEGINEYSKEIQYKLKKDI